MADLLIDANATATAARAAGQASLSDAGLARIRCWYRGAVAKGLADNTGKTSQIAKDALAQLSATAFRRARIGSRAAGTAWPSMLRLTHASDRTKGCSSPRADIRSSRA